MTSSTNYPLFEMITGPDEGKLIPIADGESSIGRSNSQTIFLDDTSVSREHAKVIRAGESITLVDLGSRNGTIINGSRLAERSSVKLNHLDQIKIGIYLLRLFLKPATEADKNIQNKPPVVSTSLGSISKNQNSSKSPDDEIVENTEKEKVTEVSKEKETDKEVVSVEPNVEDKKEEMDLQPSFEEVKNELALVPRNTPPPFEAGKGLGKIYFVIGLLCIIIGLGSIWYFRNNPKPPTEEVIENSEYVDHLHLIDEWIVPKISGPIKVIPDKINPSKTFNVFLDVTSQPFAARIFFENQDLGFAPFKKSVKVEPGKEYHVVAQFDLEDLHDQYQQKISFKADPRKEVVPVDFKAEIGVIKILKLPRAVDFYLEGFYVYDKQKANPVKLTDIIYGKPIYVPFGSYQIELHEKTRVGDSNTYVDEIRYHRDFTVDVDHQLIELTVTDRDLQFFPATITSSPSASALYIDGEKLGMTPFKGELPLGRHELKVTHDGYFDYITTLDVRTNTPYESKIELKTSKVGEMIYKAKTYRLSGQYQEAIDQLVEALKLEGTEHEKAEIHLLLGESFFMRGDFDQAAGYFEQAKSDQEYYYKALLGLAKTKNALGERDASLQYVIEILLNVKDDKDLLNDTQTLFKQLSPFKSVLYISTDPDDATVYLNREEVKENKTPLILSDLALGSYRIELEKPGFKTEVIRKELKVGDFVPIIIKLTPQQL